MQEAGDPCAEQRKSGSSAAAALTARGAAAHLDGQADRAEEAAQRAHLRLCDAHAAGVEPLAAGVAAKHGHCGLEV